MTTTAAPHSPNVPAPVPQAAAPITFTPAMIAQLLGAELDGRGDLVLSDVGGLENATSSTLSFIRSPHYALKWPGSKAGAALVTRGVQVDGHDRANRALLVVPDADMAMLKLLEVAAKRIPIHRPPVGIHPNAVVDPTAVIAPSVAVGPGCVIGPGTRIGENSVLHANVTLGMGVVIGASTILYPAVVVYDRCIVGSRCLINAGVVLGADGFGYLPDPSGRGLVKIPHIGIVEIHDDVEIGAGSCIDRGKFGSTLIGQGTKIDNLVQIAHNCRIGRGVIICGQCGLAGSVTIGDGAMLGGEVGVVDNIAIGAGARIAAKSGVLNNVGAGETSIGYPAMPGIEGQRNFAAIRHLAALAKEVKRLSRIIGEGTGRGGASGS